MSRYSSSISRSASFSSERSLSLSSFIGSSFMVRSSLTICTTTAEACSSIAARGAKSMPSRWVSASE